ncbi:hypothetical protein RWE15_22730 [Virgibacillus halophilus]|uniref:Lipoprotein n=1 Tax=Tigheibacillus halophilus TaxID=361280 RepID=A0ABU5CBH5_9BACI|nr:hypothetical protein [Virgibacillus halophilus]
MFLIPFFVRGLLLSVYFSDFACASFENQNTAGRKSFGSGSKRTNG